MESHRTAQDSQSWLEKQRRSSWVWFWGEGLDSDNGWRFESVLRCQRMPWHHSNLNLVIASSSLESRGLGDVGRSFFEISNSTPRLTNLQLPSQFWGPQNDSNYYVSKLVLPFKNQGFMIVEWRLSFGVDWPPGDRRCLSSCIAGCPKKSSLLVLTNRPTATLLTYAKLMTFWYPINIRYKIIGNITFNMI